LVMDDGLEPDHRGVHLLGGVRLEELSELLRDEGLELRDEGGEQSLFRSVPRDERDLRLWEQRGCLGSRLPLGFATVGSAHDISFSSRFSRSSRSSPVGLASARPGASSGRWVMRYSSTMRPPIRCSVMIRSRTGGSQLRYHAPSGYTTAIGPPLQIWRQLAFVR